MACRQNRRDFCLQSTSLKATLRASIVRGSISHETAAATAAVVATIGSTMMQPGSVQLRCKANVASEPLKPWYQHLGATETAGADPDDNEVQRIRYDVAAT